MLRAGPLNLITDVKGLRVGNAEDHDIKTGTTVLVGDRPFIASVSVLGGSPGTRETDLLAPEKLVQDIDALVLSGGSAFGLDAGQGVADELARRGRGFAVGNVRVPIVPGAILFDLINGGAKDWATNPYRELGRQALDDAAEDFALGTAGAGTGALTARLKGGLGSASLVLPNGVTVGALVAANPTGSVTMGERANFWAAPYEVGDEFGGLGTWAGALDFNDTALTKRGSPEAIANTTIAIVATDAAFTSKAELKRMAVAAQDGITRGASPSHSPVDGDLVFALATGDVKLRDPILDAIHIGHAAAVCLARAMARAIYLATPAPGDLLPTWQMLYGRR